MNINSKHYANSILNLELVTAPRSGNGKAQSQLREHYKDAIFYMLLKMVNNKAEAEALAAKTFENAFASLHQYNPEYPISVWLFRIASNNAIAYLKEKRAIAASQNVSKLTRKFQTMNNPGQISGVSNKLALQTYSHPTQRIVELKQFLNIIHNENI